MHSEVNIWSLVKSLLYRHNCVIIPNLGGFLAHQQSATIDPVSMLINPPYKHVTFNAQLTLNDGLLATKIADYLNINYSDAIKIIDEEVSNFQVTLRNNKVFTIAGLGSFELNLSNNLIFTPDKKANFLINSFGLEAIRLKPIGETKSTKIIHHVEPLISIDTNLIEEKGIINKPRKRKGNGLMFTAIGSILIMVLALNAYIFLQEGNLTPIRNKFDELNLGVKIKSVINQFSNSTTNTQSQAVVEVIPAITKKIELNSDSNNLTNDSLTNIPKTEITSTSNLETNITGNYYIVAGAFKSMRKANKLLEALNNEGFTNAEIIEKPKSSAKKIKFYVTYNKFSNLNETNLELSKINESENPDAWIFEAK